MTKSTKEPSLRKMHGIEICNTTKSTKELDVSWHVHVQKTQFGLFHVQIVHHTMAF